jgi:hypothetical protein
MLITVAMQLQREMSSPARTLESWFRIPVEAWRYDFIFSVRTVTDLINALPGNSSLNTVQHARVNEAEFSMSSAPCPVLLTDKLTRNVTLVFCACSVPRRCKRIWEWELTSFESRSSKGTAV